MSELVMENGINHMVPREKMSNAARKLRDVYAMKADAPIYQCEFGFYSLDRWKSEGYINDYTNLSELFGFDEPGSHSIGGLGWCEAPFFPHFETKQIEDRGEHEVVQDRVGRQVLFFKGRRTGFMPEYIAHPVTDLDSWERNCKWRLSPEDNGRFHDLKEQMRLASDMAAKGTIICQRLIGGYMFLRSLIGPVDLLYKFYDEPELIHECMKTWLALTDKVIAIHQKYVTIDELFLAEDICYNHGSLISPDMIQEFLIPYYQQLITNVKCRQIDRSRPLHIQIDTDGYADPVIPIYKSIGMDYMSPFEVASGSNVVKTSKQYPDLIIRGGIDKRVLAEGKDAIDRMVDEILPVMKKRGGYIPTCDHGVPAEVDFENYMHFRKRLQEF